VAHGANIDTGVTREAFAKRKRRNEMKHAIFASVIALGLAVPAVASAGTSSDPVAESFTRDLDREAVATATTDRAMDAFQYAVNSTLRNGSDRIVASFTRDLNRQAVGSHASQGDMDAVQYLVNSTLRNGSDQIVASFTRDLNRQAVGTYAGRHDTDTVQYLVNSTLGGGSDQIVASFERDLNRGSTLTALSESVFGVDSPDAIGTAWANITV